MSAPRSRPAISRAWPSSTCGSRARLRSSTIANPPSGSTRSPSRRPSSSVGLRDQIVVIDEDLGLSGSGTAPFRLRPADRRSGAGPGRHRARPRSLAPGAQQCRLVSAARPVRPDRHADRRCRWPLPSRAVQRSPGARAQGHDERSRTARAARPARWRHPQQGGPRRTPARPAGGLCLGRGRWRGSLSSRTKPSAPPSAPSSTASPRPARPVGSGCGSARRVSHSRCRCTNVARSAGSTPTYTAIHHVLTNPVYAGAYVYGKNPPRDVTR